MTPSRGSARPFRADGTGVLPVAAPRLSRELKATVNPTFGTAVVLRGNSLKHECLRSIMLSSVIVLLALR
jgi:hypothetical protein